MQLRRLHTRVAFAVTATASLLAPLAAGVLPAGAAAPTAPASFGSATTVAAGRPALPTSGALLGAAVSGRPEMDVKTSVTTLEGQLGRKLDVHRLYDVWDDPQPNSITAWTVANGRTPVLSIKAGRRNGSVVRWADIAAGREDDAIRAQARGIKALNAPIFLGLHHEPENDPGQGSPADYVAAWRHYINVFGSEGVTNVSFTWILMAWSFERSTVADSFYPGDDVIDVVAADGYNWYGTGPDKEWRSLAAAVSAFYAWGTAHAKPMMIAEYGTLEDPQVPGRKGAWIDESAAALKTMPGIKAALYFHAPVVFPWWLDTSTSSLAAFARMGQDPYYHTVPEATLAVTPARGPAPLAAVLDGAGSYTAGAGNLQWRLDFGDGSAPLITSTPPARVAHSYAPGTYDVELSVTDPSGVRDATTSTVTALPAPTAVTSGESDVLATRATLNGRVDPNGLETSAWFQYGPTTAYGSTTSAASVGGDTRMVPVTTAVTGLAGNTVYHYRIAARNGAGTSYGSDGTFTTPGAPGAITGSASDLAAVSAAVSGTVDANRLATDTWFEYGVTTGYGSRTATGSAGSAAGNVRVTATLTGLRANTDYHYRTVARNSSGTAYGLDRTLTTAGPATVVTGGASGLSASAATIGGNVDPNGLATSYKVEYGATTGYGTASTSRSAGSATWSSYVTVTLSGLASRRLYHYRIVATNSAGSSVGLDRTFTTR